MTAGTKNQQIAIQQRMATSDGAGGQVVTFPVLASGVWAEIRSTLTDERLDRNSINAVVGHLVVVWYADALAAVGVKDRVAWGARVLEIQSVNDPGNRHRELEWRCQEVQA
jgi:SPP1 family predicted phage head-tail adaptor